MQPLDRFAIAARLRGLLAGQDHGVVAATASRLSVSELALRISIDEIDPHPTFEVLAAVVREYGVDPLFLVNGEYDAAAHRQALLDDAAITRLLLASPGRPTPSSAVLAFEPKPDEPR